MTTTSKPEIIKFILTVIFVNLCMITVAQQSILYGDNPDAGKYISINGVKHYYEVYGSGMPLLLIHGNNTGIKGWAAQIDYFSKKYTVYAIDCRGRGKSDLGKDTLSYLQQAKDMAAFISLMKMDSVYVIGKSDGGIISLLLGMYYPDHIKKIISFSANLWPDSTAMYPQGVEEIRNKRIHAEKMLAKKDTAENWYLIQQKYRLMEFQPHITATYLHKINIPVLVLSCDRDVIKEEHTLLIYKNIPKANLCILSGETHHVPRQNPDAFNAAADKFLSGPFKDYSLRFDN